MEEVNEEKYQAEETISRLEAALQTHSSAASEMYLELQGVRQQLSAERERRNQQHDESQALDHQLSQAKSELTDLRLRLRNCSSEAGIFQTQSTDQRVFRIHPVAGADTRAIHGP